MRISLLKQVEQVWDREESEFHCGYFDLTSLVGSRVGCLSFQTFHHSQKLVKEADKDS